MTASIRIYLRAYWRNDDTHDLAQADQFGLFRGGLSKTVPTQIFGKLKIMPLFEIPVIQYNSTAHAPGHGTAPRNFQLNDRMLIIAMVRSILTANPGREARRYLAAIVKPTLTFVLEMDRAPGMFLRDNFRNILRDFSLTQRIGELAQGVSYSYFHWRENFTNITDFSFWADYCGFPLPARSAAPDFVMFDPIRGEIALMEAKGTVRNSHSGAMSRALRQCRNVFPHVLASRFFGSVLTMNTDAPLTPASLHIRDPRNGKKISLEDKYILFRRSYASWCELCGDHQTAEILRTLDLGLGKTRLKIQDNRKDPLRRFVAQALSENPEEVTFSLEDSIERALADIKYFSKLDWKKLIEKAGNTSDALIQSPDGTIVKIAG